MLDAGTGVSAWPTEEPVLWRGVAGFWNERRKAGERYWWDNANRESTPTWAIQRTRQGEIDFYLFEKNYSVSVGDVVLFRYGEASRYGQRDKLAAEYACDWIAVEGAGLDEHLGWLRRRYGAVIPGGSEPTFRDALSDAIATLGDGGSNRGQGRAAGGSSPVGRASAVARLVHGLVDLAEHGSEAGLSPTQRLADRIAADPLSSWSLKQLAAENGVSREHLCRVFRDRHGMPPHAYLTLARRRRAIWLLRHTELPLEQVAGLCGFERSYTLARHIRDETGISPLAFRRAHQRTTRPTEVNKSTALIAPTGKPSQAAAADR